MEITDRAAPWQAELDIGLLPVAVGCEEADKTITLDIVMAELPPMTATRDVLVGPVGPDGPVAPAAPVDPVIPCMP
jgi:hypothetical protein